MKISSVLCSYLGKFPGLSRYPDLRRFPGLMRSPVLYLYLEKLVVQTSVSITCTQRDALFSRVSNTIDRSHEGCGVNLEMSPNFNKFLDINLCLSKWLRSCRLPIMFDWVLFVFNDGNLNKDSIIWMLGRVSKVENTQVPILTSSKANGLEQMFIRCVRVGFKDKVRLIGISDETSRHKYYYTVCITVSYFSTWRTGDFWVRVEERLRAKQDEQYVPELSVLIPQEGVKKPGNDQRKRIKLANLAKTESNPKPVPGFSSNGSRERFGSGSVVSREHARPKTKKAGQILSYDELIAGEDAISVLDDLDFRFDVPEDVKNIELV